MPTAGSVGTLSIDVQLQMSKMEMQIRELNGKVRSAAASNNNVMRKAAEASTQGWDKLGSTIAGTALKLFTFEKILGQVKKGYDDLTTKGLEAYDQKLVSEETLAGVQKLNTKLQELTKFRDKLIAFGASGVNKIIDFPATYMAAATGLATQPQLTRNDMAAMDPAYAAKLKAEQDKLAESSRKVSEIGMTDIQRLDALYAQYNRLADATRNRNLTDLEYTETLTKAKDIEGQIAQIETEANKRAWESIKANSERIKQEERMAELSKIQTARSEIASYKDELQEPLDRYIAKLDRIRELETKYGMDSTLAAKARTAAMEEYMKTFPEVETKMGEFQVEMDHMWQDVSYASGDAFAEMVLTGENAFKRIPEMIAGQILSAFARLAIINPIMNALFSWTSGWAMLPTMFGGNRASGGEVSPGNVYRVNEHGEEFFAPSTPGVIIPRNVSHALEVGAQMGGGRSGVSVHQTYNIATGVSHAELIPALQQWGQAIKSSIVDDIARGGRRGAAFAGA